MSYAPNAGWFCDRCDDPVSNATYCETWGLCAPCSEEPLDDEDDLDNPNTP